MNVDANYIGNTSKSPLRTLFYCEKKAVVALREYEAFWLANTQVDLDVALDGDQTFDGDGPMEDVWTDIFDGEPLYVYPRREWTASDRYNFFDLNAVESNAKTVAALLTEYRGQPVVITVVTDRDMTRIEFYDSLNRIEGNIQTLADNFFEPVGWIDPKTNWQSGQPFDWQDARRLEINLKLIYDLLLKAFDTLKYCGTFYAGEDGDIY